MMQVIQRLFNRREFLSWGFAVTAGLCLAPWAMGTEEARTRPNFLIILVDDMGYGDPGCYGNKIIRTPHIDQLAREGIRFTDCYAPAPVCSPSRAAMLTGRTPNRLGIYDWISDAQGSNFMCLKTQEVTLAELLKAAGYTTSVVDKWHCNGKFNHADQPKPSDHGFDHWYVSAQNLKRQLNPYQFVHNGKQIVTQKGYACEVVAHESIRWLNQERDRQRPFFQCVWFHEPHEPIDAPPDLVKEYGAYEGTRPLYYANVTNLDRQIGKVLKNLEQQGLSENTVVLFTSDNGPAKLQAGYRSRSHGTAGPLREYKWTLFEGGIRVPGIMRWPGHTQAGQVINEPISGVDVLPTFCRIAGVSMPDDRVIDGVDLSPMFSGKRIVRKIPLHWHYYAPYAGPLSVMRKGVWVVTGQWDIDHPVMGRMKKEHVTLIKKAKLRDFKLYNLRDDIGQTTDVGDTYPQRLKEMSAELVRLYTEVQAEAPTW